MSLNGLFFCLDMNNQASEESPKTTIVWRNKLPEQRLNEVETVCDSSELFKKIKVSRVLPDGNVFVNLLEPLPPNIRGTLLLDLEAELKLQIDHGIVVWCEPLGDKSTLRNLRGIEIKTERVADPRR